MPGSGAVAQTMAGGGGRGGGREKSAGRITSDVRADCNTASRLAGVV